MLVQIQRVFFFCCKYQNFQFLQLIYVFILLLNLFFFSYYYSQQKKNKHKNDFSNDNVSVESSSSMKLVRKNKLKNFNYLNTYVPKIKITLVENSNINNDSVSCSDISNGSLNKCSNKHYFTNLPALHNYNQKRSFLFKNSNCSLNSITTIRYIYYIYINK